VLSFVLLGMLAGAILTYIVLNATNPAVAGILTGGSKQGAVKGSPAPSSASVQKDLSKIETTYKLIKDQYVSEVDKDKIINGAINGMLGALDDPFTVYMDQKEAKQFEESISSTFQGIGAEVSMEDGKVTVVSPIKGSPAEKAGIRSGDVILSVNGETLEGLTLNQAVMKIRGMKGTEAKIKLSRAGLSETMELTIVRDDIDVETIYAEMLDNHIGKIELTQFSSNTADRFLSELDKLEKQGMKGLIIDVRNDPGGILEVVVKILNAFVPNGKPVVIVEDRAGKRESTLSKGGTGKPYPVVVLTNKGSASASEILAGALQETVGAKVVGETTYGKGTVQMTFAKELGDGSNIKMTVFKWLTPNGNWIHKKGIVPDVKVDQPEYFKVTPLSKKTVLKTGSTGDDVTHLQVMLRAVGQKAGGESGVYTADTAAGVKAFQAANQLKATGEVDVATAGKLEKAVMAQIRNPQNDLQLKAAIDELMKQIGR